MIHILFCFCLRNLFLHLHYINCDGLYVVTSKSFMTLLHSFILLPGCVFFISYYKVAIIDRLQQLNKLAVFLFRPWNTYQITFYNCFIFICERVSFICHILYKFTVIRTLFELHTLLLCTITNIVVYSLPNFCVLIVANLLNLVVYTKLRRQENRFLVRLRI